MQKTKNSIKDKSLIVDLTNTNLAKSNEVLLAIAKAKKEYNKIYTEDKLILSKFEKHLIKASKNIFRKAWKFFKNLL